MLSRIIITVIVLGVLISLFFILYSKNSKVKAPYVVDDAACKSCNNLLCKSHRVEDATHIDDNCEEKHEK